MTIRDLRKMIMKIHDDKILDMDIRYCFENEYCGMTCENAWFDIQNFKDGGFYPTITVCDTIKSYNLHDGRASWDKLPRYLSKEF